MNPRAQLSSLVASARANRRDALRLAAQTAAASALAYLVMAFFGLPHMGWAVIAAVFTIHPSADSTLWSAAGRLLAALIGICIGVLSIMIVGGEDHFLVRLLIAAAAAGGIAAIWPSLNYVGVIAVVMALHPHPELGDALLRALSIMVGATAGVAATLVLWPEYGTRRTIEFIENTLVDLRDLLDLVLRDIDAAERRERDALYAQFLSRLETARAMAAESWIAPRLASGASLRDALRLIESLWHGLVILDRVITEGRKSLGDPALAALRPHIEDVKQAACAFTDALIATLHGDNPSWPQPRLEVVIGRAREAAQNVSVEDNSTRGDHSRAVHALIFALDELERNFTAVGQLIVPAMADADRRDSPAPQGDQVTGNQPNR